VSQPDTSIFAPISERLISSVCVRLAEDKQVRRTLPLDGRLHIDRQLPFLVIYRQPRQRPGDGTRRLVLGEASYMIASADKRLRSSLTALTTAIVKTLSEQFNAFLIIEIWTTSEKRSVDGTEPLLPKPDFRILTSRVRPPTATVEALAKSLQRIRILKQAATVDVINNRKRSPAGLPMLVSPQVARQLISHIHQGNRVKCSSCDVILEVAGTNPLELDVASPACHKFSHRDASDGKLRPVTEKAGRTRKQST